MCYVRREFGRQYHFLEVMRKCFGSETERPVEGGQVGAFDRSDPAHLGLSCGAVRVEERRKLQAGSNAAEAVAVQESQVRGQMPDARLATACCQSGAVRECSAVVVAAAESNGRTSKAGRAMGTRQRQRQRQRRRAAVLPGGLAARSRRATDRYSAAIHAELAAQARQDSRVFPCSHGTPTICVRQRLA